MVYSVGCTYMHDGSGERHLPEKAKPGTTRIARQLRRVLRTQPGRWWTHQDIASAIERKRLNPNHIAQLQNMSGAGLIDSRKVDAPGPLGYQWEYRVSN